MYQFVGEVRCQGLSFGIDLIQPSRVKREAHPLLAQFIRQKLFECQVVVEVCGAHRNVIGLSPNFSITLQDADLLVRQLNEVFNLSRHTFGRTRRKSDSEKGGGAESEGGVASGPGSSRMVGSEPPYKKAKYKYETD